MPPRTAGSQGATSRSIVGTGSMTLAAAIAHSNLRPERYSKISVARATLSSAKVAVLTISESVRLTSFMLEPERTQLTSPALTKHSSGSGVVPCSVFLLFFFMLSPIICTQFLPAFNRWATVNRDDRKEQPACGFLNSGTSNSAGLFRKTPACIITPEPI